MKTEYWSPRKRAILLLVLSLFVTHFVWSDNIPNKSYLTSREGLSNSSINCMLQDSCGLLWLGTWDGLNMYDSREIKVFKPDLTASGSNISNNIIRHIIEERKGIIWIATDYGINRYDVYTGEFTKYFCSPAPMQIFKEHSFLLARQNNGLIYSYIKGLGLHVYQAAVRDFKVVPLQEVKHIRQMLFDGLGQLWACDDNGELYCITLKNEVAIASVQKIDPGKGVEKIFYDPIRDEIWVQAADKTLFEIDPVSKSLHPADFKPAEEILVISFDRDFCHIGTLKGLDRWDFNQHTLASVLEDISVHSICKGQQGILWVGTDARGAIGLSESQNKFTRSSQIRDLNFGNAPVRAFYRLPDSTLLVGTKGMGLFFIDETSHSARNIKLLHNSVYALAGDKEYVWICTEGQGLDYYSMDRGGEILQVNGCPAELRDKYAIYCPNDSTLWIGTNGYGLFHLTIDRKPRPVRIKSYKQYKYENNCEHCLSSNSVFSLLPDAERGLWIGTRGGGLNYLDFASGMFHEYRHDPSNTRSLSNDDVLCLSRTSDGSIWIGTSNGLNHLTEPKTGIFEWYTEKEGMPNNTVHGILEDPEGFLWVSTNRGLARINHKERKIVTYFQTDGLQDDEFSDGAFFRPDHSPYFFFGGINGYTRFEPAEIKDYTYMPQLYLSAFSVNNTRMSLPHKLTSEGVLHLKYQENLITFGFVPIDYIQGNKCEIAYKIEGYNTDWAYLGTSGTIVLNNLPPGKYVLLVKSCNANREWSERLYTLPIRVSPPWWSSWYACVAYVLAIIATAVFLHRNAMYKMKMKRDLEIEMLENQKAEEIHQAKLRFFTNIAHEFCNSLTLIYGPSEHLSRLCGENPIVKRYLSIIKSNAERMRDMIQQLMEFRKAETGYLELSIQKTDITDLILSTTNNFIEVADEKNISFDVRLPEDPVFWNTDPGAFEKIVFNLLSNAFKYTPEHGVVSLTMNVADGKLNVSVRNTGMGIRDEEKSIVFNRFKVLDHFEDQILNGLGTRTGIGLALCKSLMDLLKGTVQIESQVNEYTNFILCFPTLEETEPRSSAMVPHVVKPMDTDHVRSTKSVEKQNEIQDKSNTILIIDDDDDIRLFLTDILQDEYNVLSASDGISALDLLKKQTPDIIISDIIMPGMNGFELIEQIKKQDLSAHIPIILLSSDTSVDSKIESASIGADLYMTKPFHEKHLLANIKQLLSSRKDLKDYFKSPISSIDYVDGKPVHKEDKEFIKSLTRTIIDNMDRGDFSVSVLTREMGISKMQLYRKLKEIKDETPTDFIRKVRLNQAEVLLKTTNYTIQEVMYKCGFNNKAYFYRVFFKQYQKTPKEFRDDAKESIKSNLS